MSMSLESLMRSHAPEEREVPAGIELISFVLIAAAAALGFVAVSWIVIAAASGLPVWLASTLAYVICVLPAYLAHRHYSFRSNTPHWRALPVYLCVNASSIVLALLFSYLAYGVIAMPTVSAALTVIILTSGVNYFLLKAWAFGRKTQRLPS